MFEEGGQNSRGSQQSLAGGQLVARQGQSRALGGCWKAWLQRRETGTGLQDGCAEYCTGLRAESKCDANMEVSKLSPFLLWPQQHVCLFWVGEREKGC